MIFTNTQFLGSSWFFGNRANFFKNGKGDINEAGLHWKRNVKPKRVAL